MENQYTEDLNKKSEQNAAQLLDNAKSKEYKNENSVDQLHFYLDLNYKNGPALDSYVEMRGLRFSGPIKTQALVDAVRESFTKYFISIMRLKQPVVKEDFIKVVNSTIFPSKITRIDEIDVSLSLLKTSEVSDDNGNSDNDKKPGGGSNKGRKYSYNQLIQKINDKKAELPQEKDAEPEIPDLQI